jgi:hypothetical protein
MGMVGLFMNISKLQDSKLNCSTGSMHREVITWQQHLTEKLHIDSNQGGLLYRRIFAHLPALFRTTYIAIILNLVTFTSAQIFPISDMHNKLLFWGSWLKGKRCTFCKCFRAEVGSDPFSTVQI